MFEKCSTYVTLRSTTWWKNYLRLHNKRSKWSKFIKNTVTVEDQVQLKDGSVQKHKAKNAKSWIHRGHRIIIKNYNSMAAVDADLQKEKTIAKWTAKKAEKHYHFERDRRAS